MKWPQMDADSADERAADGRR